MAKTAIITGGATGIGAAISSLLSLNGFNVIITYNTSEKEATLLANEIKQKGGTAEIFKSDITDSKSVDNLFDFAVTKFGTVDVLIANAGVAQQKQINDITDDDFNTMIATDLSGCFYCNRAAAKIMVKQHSGCIINISSMWGLVGASCESHYSAAKAGVIGLTKSLAKELGPSNIRVNAIAPGVIKTKMLKGFSDEDLKTLADETPLCRIGTPEDVANLVSFLASDKASFITGQTISVDGGFAL